MLSDRSYMRDSYGRTSTSTLTWMLCALTAGFFIQTVFERAFEASHFTDLAGLTVAGIKSGWFWTLFSYPLLHANVILWLGNVVTIYFLGRELLPLLGEKRFVWLSLSAALCGGIVWLLVHFGHPDTLIGATPIPCALLILFACLHPDRPLSFLFFFMPITVRPKHLAWGLIAISVIGLAANEIPGDRLGTHIAHSAHLGGMFAALLYYRFIHLREWRTPDGHAEVELPRWLNKTAKTAPQSAAKYTVNISTPAASSRETLRAEVDRILDKINSQGISALTAEEKRLLDDARDQLSRH